MINKLKGFLYFTWIGMFCLMMSWHYSHVRSHNQSRGIANHQDFKIQNWYDPSFKL